jgi:putative DNA primase/helicase
MSRDLFEDWRYRADQADLLETASKHGANLKRAGREHIGPCPNCGGNDRFAIHPTKHKWHCRSHGGGHGAISMLQHIAGLTFLEACEELTGEPNPTGERAKPLSPAEKADRARIKLQMEARNAARKAQEAERESNTREAAFDIWNVSAPISGPAAAYLSMRGFTNFSDPVLRFHPALTYPGIDGKHPVLVCRVDDVAGTFAGIWRIYLTPTGEKLNSANPKLGLGPCAGGAVRIGGIARHIGAAEGLESALGAHFLIGRKYPVWPCLSTSGLIGFEIPMLVERLTLFCDGDRPIKKNGDDYLPAVPAGRRAVQSLRQRAINEGVGCDIAAEPPPQFDFCDLWRSRQREMA